YSSRIAELAERLEFLGFSDNAVHVNHNDPEIAIGQIERVGDRPIRAIDHDLTAESKDPESDIAFLRGSNLRVQLGRQQPGHDYPKAAQPQRAIDSTSLK